MSPPRLLLSLACLLWALVALGEATTYYVSGGGLDSRTCDNARTITTPLLTIAKGMTCLNSLGNLGGDILYLRAGTYPEIVDVPPNKGGTSDTNRNMIAAYPGEIVIVNRGGENAAMRFVSPSATRQFRYFIFDGIIWSGGIGQNHNGGSNTGHNIYRNGEVRNAIKGSGFSGLGEFDEIHHMKIHDNGFGNVLVQQTHGIYACRRGISIHDNEIYHNAAYGIQFYDSGEGNTDCASDVKIYNNKIYDNSAILISDNPLSHSAGGMVVCCGSNIEIYNNLIYSNGRTPGAPPGGGLQFLATAGPGTGYKVYNNTLWNNNGAGIQIVAGIPAIALKNNIFWQNNGLALDDRSGNTPLDATNLSTTDPLFKSTTGTVDLTPATGSPAINTGTVLAYSGFATDFFNKPRPGVAGTASDKGAIEVPSSGGPPPVEPPPVGGIGTFYVAPPPAGSDTANDCTEAKQPATPKATITGTQGGLSCLTDGGSTLLIKAGTYAEEIDTSVRRIPGGTDWEHATTIAAFGNDVVTLQIVGGGVGLFFKNPATDHYIVLDRLIVDGGGQNNTNGFVCYPGAHHIRFQNGEIKNTWYEPVYISDGAGCEVLHSQLHDWGNLSGIHALGAVSGTILRGNTLFNGPGAGIKIDSNEKTPHVAIDGTVIEQNTLHHVGVGSSLPGILVGGSDHTTAVVRNNLIYSSYRGIEIVTGSPAVKVYNNTVYDSLTTGIQINTGAVDTHVKNNIAYGNASTPILNSCPSSDLLANQILDPSFVNALGGDFRLQSISTAIDAGTNLAPEVIFDRNGVTRSAYRAYDIGAFEFTGTPSGSGSGSGDLPGPRRGGKSDQSREMFQSR